MELLLREQNRYISLTFSNEAKHSLAVRVRERLSGPGYFLILTAEAWGTTEISLFKLNITGTRIVLVWSLISSSDKWTQLSTVKNDRVFPALTRQGPGLKGTRNRWECLIRQSLSMKVMAQSGRFGSFICFAWIIIVAGILKRIFSHWIDLSLALNSAVW